MAYVEYPVQLLLPSLGVKNALGSAWGLMAHLYRSSTCYLSRLSSLVVKFLQKWQKNLVIGWIEGYETQQKALSLSNYARTNEFVHATRPSLSFEL